MAQTLNVTTSKGNTEFYLYPIGENYNPVPGVYMFLSPPAGIGSWTILYIGQTDNLDQRLSNHPKEAGAKAKGATHVLSRVYSNEAERLNEEAWLINYYKPALNTLLK